MMYLLTLIYVLTLVSCGDPATIEINCEDGEASHAVKCEFTDPGTYVLKNVGDDVNTVWFNKLTNSNVKLPNGIRKLIISLSTFDDTVGCNHVISENEIQLYIEDIDVEEICVSMTLFSTHGIIANVYISTSCYT